MLKLLHVNTALVLLPSSRPRNATHGWIGSVFESYASIPPHCKSTGDPKRLPFWSLKQKASSNSK